MKRALTNREKFLLVLLGLGAVALYFGFGQGVGQGRDAASRLAGAEGMDLGDPPRVRMDLLEQRAASFDPSGRNLFAYYTPIVPVHRPQIDTTFKPPTPPPVIGPPIEAPPPLPPPPPRAPVPGFRYLGYIGPKDKKIAAFAVDDGVTLARVGDIVAKQFKLVEFKYETVVIGYVDEKWQGQTTELKMSAK